MKTRWIALLTVINAAFVGFVAWRQNVAGAVGGPISTPKCLWLALTLTTFVSIPLCLWRATAIPAGLRRLFGLVAAGFLLRGAIEIPLLHHTRAWRCEYGIAHDLATLVLVAVLSRRIPRNETPGDKSARFFAGFMMLTLGIEMVMAWLFHNVADPASGIYYAADTETFRSINRFTLAVVTVLWPALAFWFIRTRKVAP